MVSNEMKWKRSLIRGVDEMKYQSDLHCDNQQYGAFRLYHAGQRG